MSLEEIEGFEYGNKMQRVLKLRKGVADKKLDDGDGSSESNSESEDAISDLPQAQGVEVKHTRLDSFSSITSIYSADGGKGHYGITGKIQVGVWFKNNILFTRVVKASGLAAAKGEVSDPYVKTYLLPDRSKLTKRKTGIQRKTINPQFNETLRNKLLSSDIGLSTLWLSVWDWDKYGRNKFLGEIRLPLHLLDLTNPKDCWYILQDKSELDPVQDKGNLKVAIKFCPYETKSQGLGKGSLFVSVKEATGLPIMDPNGLTDASVKMYLLPSRSTIAKKKTKIINNDLNPAWNEEFEFRRVSLEDVRSRRVLELTVWDYDRRGCKDFIGCLRLGPNPASCSSPRKGWMDSAGEEVAQWEAMLSNLGEWVEQEHHLRPSIEELEVSAVAGVLHSTTRGQGGPLSEDQEGRTADDLAEEDQTDAPSSRQNSIPPLSSILPLASIESIDEDDDSLSDDKLSLYSESCVQGEYTITGEICISLEYKQKLRVTIHEARGLAAADSNGLSDPYVKTYLLPDKSKHSKGKTEVKKKTLNPVYNETLLYDVEVSALPSRTLLLTVWDWDMFGKNEFLGEARVPLSSVNLSNCRRQIYALQDADNFNDMSSAASTANRGKLTLSLMFDPNLTKKRKDKGTLHINIQSAIGLPNMDTDGLTDGFVKMSLLPNKAKRKKSRVVSNDLAPVWNEKFTFMNVTLDELATQRVLELTVWDHDTLSSNDFIGALRLGPTPSKVEGREEWMDSGSTEAKHWEDMLARAGEWVESTHSLRPTMSPRNLDNPDLVIEEVDNSPTPSNTVEKEEHAAGAFRPRVTQLVTQRKRREDGLVLSGQQPSEESVTKEELPLPVAEHDVGGESSPSPVASPFHIKHPIQQQVETSDTPQPHSSLAVQKPSTQGVGVADQKRLCLSTQEPVSGGAGGTGISGEVLCAMSYGSGHLTVHINRARGLSPSADYEPPSPYIEVLLLPEKDKNSAKQTVRKMKTCEPVFDCSVKFKVSASELPAHILWLRVWDSDQTPGAGFLGEINLLLAKQKLADTTACWYSLHDKIESEACELNIAMKFQLDKKGKPTGSLHLLLKQTRNLPTSDCNAKCSLISGPVGRKKSSVINCGSLPVCSEELVFPKLKLQELASEKALEVSLWNQSGQLIGGFRLGPAPGRGKQKEWMDSTGEEVRHWESVMTHPGEWQEAWHKLRTIMDPNTR